MESDGDVGSPKGGNIAVLIVRIEKARICDIQDRVTHWDAANARR